MLTILLFACQKANDFQFIKVVGHAGAGLDVERIPFPSNTQASLDYAASMGAKHVEVDLHLSADNHWILFHDDYLQLRTNFVGCIREYTKHNLAELRFLGFSNIGVQSLLDTDFSQFESVFLDLRHYDACSGFALLDTAFMHQDILETVHRFPNQRFVILSRFVPVLNHFKDLNLEVCHEVIDFEAIQTSANNFGFDFFALRNGAISGQELSVAQSSGWRVLLFDVKSHAGNSSAMKKSPNFVMTDALVSAIELTK